MTAPMELLPEKVSVRVNAAVAGGRFVKSVGNSDPWAVTPVTGTTDQALGVAYEDGAAGDTIAVVVGGFVSVEASAAISVGALVGPSANGRAVALTPAEGATAYVHGIAREQATAEGDFILVQIVPPTSLALAPYTP